MDPEASLIEEFLRSEKEISVHLKWFHQANTDTAQCTLPVFVSSRPSFNSRLALTAHVSRLPDKYGFALLLGNVRVGALDVNPGRAHTNFKAGIKETVTSTHWHAWPNVDHAAPDDRTLSHRYWLKSFLEKYGIRFSGSYHQPPHYGGEQLRLF